MQAEALWITDKLKKDFFTALRKIELAPGATWDFSYGIQVATERNPWIFNSIINNSGNDRKPSPEKQVSLSSLVDLKITTPDESGSGSKVLHQGFIPVTLGSETASLMYPDLTKLAGRPLASRRTWITIRGVTTITVIPVIRISVPWHFVRHVILITRLEILQCPLPVNLWQRVIQRTPVRYFPKRKM